MYSGQGTDFQDNGANGSLRYGYLNIPVLIKYQHPSGVFAETGLQIGFPVSKKETLNGNSITRKTNYITTILLRPICVLVAVLFCC
jgi:hypothetical protein